jgi:hypothetical protein
MYFEAGFRKFKVERVTEHHYELTVTENGEEYRSGFTGSLAYEKCLAEILSYSEISKNEYED